MKPTPRNAMVLAAGFGTRMHPLTEKLPKPLVAVAGRALIDHVLDRLAAAGVERAVVNIHHFAEQMIHHLEDRTRPRITISDERGLLLGTGGGVKKALPQLNGAPFFHINSDTLWIDRATPNLARLALAFDPAAMDALLLLAPAAGSIGYDGRGDFVMAPDGRLQKRGDQASAPFVYAGAAILSPALFARTRLRANSRSRCCSTAPPRRGACMGCGWTAGGCMWARPTPSRRRKPRSKPIPADRQKFSAVMPRESGASSIHLG